MYSDQVRVIVVSVLLPFLAFISILVRLHARGTQRARLNGADWWIILTLIIQVGGSILNIVGAAKGGLGAPLETLTQDEAILFSKAIFGQQFFYITSIATIKVSVILFYKSIFGGGRRKGLFNLTSNIFLGIIAAWWIALFFATLFQNIPISTNWDGNEGTSIDFGALYVAEGATDIFFDVAILCMPLPVIQALKLSTKKRWLIAGVFWLGAFCCVCSGVRLHYVVEFNGMDPTTDSSFSGTVVNIVVWSTVEPCVSIITASLPTYGPLLGRNGMDIKKFVFSLYSLISSPLGSRSRVVDPESSAHDTTVASHSEKDVDGSKAPATRSSIRTGSDSEEH